ncbi:sphingomyelin phosphodiesterase [Babesia caballi]|uniref:Sphingomyelin phosphodiesterase n=1 Tax=Babesia caballi TaxID=5871 RepID=A0AAV4LWT7_BABCB|nr:sphingomyelin phosphodiesterase [Babesia caballi]
MSQTSRRNATHRREVRVLKRVLRRYAPTGVQSEHLHEQVQPQLRHVAPVVGTHAVLEIRVEVGLVLLQRQFPVLQQRQLRVRRPGVRGRSAAAPEDPVQRVHVVGAHEERLPADDLREYAPHRPHVHRLRVLLLPQEELRRPVPVRDDVLRVVFYRVPELARHAEVAYLEHPAVVVQDVGGLQVPVQHPVRVHVRHAQQQLAQQALALRERELRLSLVQQRLELVLHVLHDHVEVVPRLVGHHLLHAEDVGVLELEQDRYLPQVAYWEALLPVRVVELDVLERHDFPGLLVQRPVDSPVRALRYLIEALVVFHAAARHERGQRRRFYRIFLRRQRQVLAVCLPDPSNDIFFDLPAAFSCILYLTRRLLLVRR